MPELERRRHPRVNLVTRVTHILSDTAHYYYSRDLSVGGIFLETKKPYALGAKLLLDFSLPERTKRIKAEGEVVRVVKPDPKGVDRATGMGISFTQVSPEGMTELKEFLLERED